MLVAHNDPTGSSSLPKTRDKMMTVPTSLIQQEEYCGLEEIKARKVDETTEVHVGDGGQVVGNHHGSFISSLVLEEWPLLGDGDDEEDREDTILGLNDQDKWELKFLFSTIHEDPEQDRSGVWLSSPKTAREDSAGSCSNHNDSSHLISSVYNETSLLVGETTTKPDSAISQVASCEDRLPTGYHASHHTRTLTHQEVQSPPKNNRLKPISTSSTLETIVLSDCSLSRNDSLALQSSSSHAREPDVLDNHDDMIQRDSPGVGDSCSTSSRFRIYQEDQWMQQYAELKKFAKETGHTFVPCGYPDRDSLARWTKRQRYQYKLRSEGKVSTMTKERIALLDELGFIWNSQIAVWEKRLGELKHYKRLTGHCNVPSHFSPNQKLATWVKCQRRQYKLLTTGRKSNMTMDRAKILENLGFVWELRCHPQRNHSPNEQHYKY